MGQLCDPLLQHFRRRIVVAGLYAAETRIGSWKFYLDHSWILMDDVSCFQVLGISGHTSCQFSPIVCGIYKKKYLARHCYTFID